MFRRMLLLGILGFAAAAAPPLTTIQDVLYKADGTRFSGTLTISWNSFQAVDHSDIVTQTTTVKVVDGNLRVQLVPTTSSVPPITYKVTYNSDGRIQFQETWSVPSSAQPLRVRDVRTTAAATAPAVTAANDTSTGGTGPVNESDVVGLIADLGARPLKGTGYAAGRVAVVDPIGMIASVTGDPSDCVRVDGSSGPCGGSSSSPSFVDGESLSGIVDGSNATFGISAIPDPVTSLAVYRNGVLQKSGQDFTLSGSTVQFASTSTPQPGDTLLASYRTSTPVTVGAPPVAYPQVLCSGTGGSTNSGTLANIGNCQIPAGVLLPGDRIEIRFDLAHQGTGGPFSLEARWGSTVMVHCDADTYDALIAGRADGVILPSGAQFNSQSWGTVLPFSVTVGIAPDDLSEGLTISFYGMTTQTADGVSLANFTVVRIP